MQSKLSKYAILRKSIMASIALIDEALTDDSSKSSSQVNIHLDLSYLEFLYWSAERFAIPKLDLWWSGCNEKFVEWHKLYIGYDII